MRKMVHKKLLLFVSLFLINGSSSYAVEPRSLSEELDQFLLLESILTDATVGLHIRKADTGEVIYDHHGSQRMTPASNLKLYTAAAVLDTLGENYQFTTEALIDGPIDRGILKGNLYLKGGGDPTLLVEDLAELATMVENSGIHTIEGRVIGDDTRYDQQRYSMDMPWSDEEAYYGAEITALNLAPDQDYDTGTVRVDVRPGKRIGSKASYQVYPSLPYFNIVNQVVTTPSKQKGKITFSRTHGSNEIVLTGSIPVDQDRKQEWISVNDANVFTTAMFENQLKQKGIKTSGQLSQGEVPLEAMSIGTHASMPLKDVLKPFMKQSNNVHAEMLLKEMGRTKYNEGSFAKGLEAMKMVLVKVGIDPTQSLIRDGSGISHVNLIRPVDITSLLYYAQKQPWFRSFYASLPVAGISDKRVGGTLRNRLTQDEVRGKVIAKTGTLTTVSSISGYIQTKTQGTLIFSFITNHVFDEEEVKKTEDRLLKMLAVK